MLRLNICLIFGAASEFRSRSLARKGGYKPKSSFCRSAADLGVAFDLFSCVLHCFFFR